MTLKQLVSEAGKIAEAHGFHECKPNTGEKLMLIVSELSEALEADRKDKWVDGLLMDTNPVSLEKEEYEHFVRGTFEEEIADAVIRLADFCYINNIDLDWHVRAKMSYNKNREFIHGKKY